MDRREPLFPGETTCLVTGGAGFIGSHLCGTLLDRGARVRSLDDLSRGNPANAALFAGRPGYRFIRGDIRDLDACLAACDGVDLVFHQAAWGSVPRSIEEPLPYEEINIRGTLNMMEAARRARVRRFIYASSSSVYGDSEELPKKEGREGRVLSPYALTKRANEEYGRLYARLYGLETVGLRYFNVFGERQDPSGAYAAVIPRFISRLLAGERPVIDGDGRQTRDFTYVADVVQANLRACRAPAEACGRVFNVACGGRERVLDIYREICRALGVTVEPEFGPPRPGDIRHSHADITLARDLLGYEPEYDFAAGIARAIGWYRASLGRDTPGA